MEMKSKIDNELMDLAPIHENRIKKLKNEELLNNGKHNRKSYLNKTKIQTENSVDNGTTKDRPSPKIMRVSKTKKILIFGIAWITISVGIILGNLWTSIFNKILNCQLVLSPGSESYSVWKETPIPMYLKIHLFNWTNVEEFEKNRVKPHFEELGPYVFREVDYKVNQRWNKNGTVTFNLMRVWHFEESLSSGSLNDQVTNINPISITLGYKFRYKKISSMIISGLLSELNETLAVTKTVRELLFEGYEDELLNLAKTLNISTGFPVSKVGWFYGRNESKTYDGTFNMLTGFDSILGTGILQQWNYKKKSEIYPGECSNINGLLGDLSPPLLHNDSIPVFAPDICTVIHLKYNNMISHLGISGKQFTSSIEMFDNGTKVPSRACYTTNEFQPSGTLNVSTCKFGAPVFMSLPHFYLADESYLNPIEGMKPDKDKHEFSFAIQPDLGLPLQVRGRLQVNLLLQSIEHISMFSNMPKIYMPIFWFTQEADLTPSFANRVKFILIMPLLGHVTLYGIAGIGVLLLFIGACILIRERNESDDIQNLISKTEEDSAVITNE